MAYQNGNPPGKQKVQTTATGNAADTGTPVSIPPTKRPPDFDKDFTWGRQGYGGNAYGGASSDMPGKRTRADMSVNNDDSDPVLNTIRQHGTAAMVPDPTGDNVESVRGTPATQLRKIGNKNVADAFGMASARSRQPSYPGPKTQIPGALTDDQSEPVRKPA